MITNQNPDIENNQDLLHIFLAKLFYAVAMADGKIAPEEIAALKYAILQKWHIANHASIETNLQVGHNILSVFNKLERAQADSDRCFLEFRLFFLEHEVVFNQELRKLIWHTAQAIASSYAQKNKSELILLAKLRILLEN